MSQMSMSNPLQGLYSLCDAELIEGSKYLKVYFRVIHREHEGYCSGEDLDYVSGEERDNYLDLDITRTIDTTTLYYRVPSMLQEDTTFDMKPELYDAEDGTVKNTDETEALFEDIIKPSDCGIGIEIQPYCGLYNTFIPITIHYVRYTR
jgi:hypothetical protein